MTLNLEESDLGLPKEEEEATTPLRKSCVCLLLSYCCVLLLTEARIGSEILRSYWPGGDHAGPLLCGTLPLSEVRAHQTYTASCGRPVLARHYFGTKTRLRTVQIADQRPDNLERLCGSVKRGQV
jgi:hypothetical protein